MTPSHIGVFFYLGDILHILDHYESVGGIAEHLVEDDLALDGIQILRQIGEDIIVYLGAT